MKRCETDACLYDRVREALLDFPYGGHFRTICAALHDGKEPSDPQAQLINRTLRTAIGRRDKKISYLPLQSNGRTIKTGMYILDSSVNAQNLPDILHHVKHYCRNVKKQNPDLVQPQLEQELRRLAGLPPAEPIIEPEQRPCCPFAGRSPQNIPPSPAAPANASTALVSSTMSSVFDEAAAQFARSTHIPAPPSPFTEDRVADLVAILPTEEALETMRGVMEPYIRIHATLVAGKVPFDEEVLWEALLEDNNVTRVLATILQQA